jgi:hypothetical protein
LDEFVVSCVDASFITNVVSTLPSLYWNFTL